MRRAMQAHIGHALEPELPLVIEIRIIQERAAIDEIAAHVADGTLDFPFGLRAIRAARAWRKAPMVSKPKELGIANQRPAFKPQVSRDHRLHLIEQQLLWDAPKGEK